jgi:hypothetical protein
VEVPLELDDPLKRLLRELGHSINDAVSESERVSKTLAEVRGSGFDIVVKLDATIGLARREATGVRITPHDRRFLESLRIRVDIDNEEHLQAQDGDEPRNAEDMQLTPQDIRFLQSLKISLDDNG